MPVRKPKGSGVGATGQSKVTALFESFDWGVSPVPEQHDLGTDLWISPRDDRGWDVQTLLGAQVKTSRTKQKRYFKSPEYDSAGQIVGSWLREDKDHFGYWAQHSVPHLVVLHCLEDDTTYWAHVKPEDVKDTGKGAKILVPARQRLVTEQSAELLKVASTGRREAIWEGSAWMSEAILPEDRLRTALIAPRLIAPHPNRGWSSISPNEALAMLVQLRIRELDTRAPDSNLQGVPEDAEAHGNWLWRLFASLRAFLENGDPGLLQARLTDAPGGAELAAATATYAGVLHEQGQIDVALAAIESCLQSDSLSPIDRLWIGTHRAWALLELGRAEESKELAAMLQIDAGLHRGDVMASALAASLADLMFSADPLNTPDVAGMIIANDTTVRWWREQTLGRGGLERMEGEFKVWASQEREVDERNTSAWLSIRAVVLQAGLAAGRSDWRRALSVLAREQLLSASSDQPDPIVDSLQMLRLVGEDDAIEQTGSRLLREGPAQALREAASQLDLERATRSSLRGDIALVEAAGDVLDEQTADAAIAFVLRTLTDPTAFVARHNPTFHIPMKLLTMTARVVGSASEQGRREIAQHMRDLPPQTDPLAAMAYSKVLNEVPAAEWPEDLVHALAERDGDSQTLRQCIDRLAARRDPVRREALLEHIAAGDLDALNAFGDVRDLPSGVVQSFVGQVRRSVEAQISTAGQGYTMGGQEPLIDLTIVCLNHPDEAPWPLIAEAIAKGAGSPQSREAVMRRIAARPYSIPSEQRAEVVQAIKAARNADPEQIPWFRSDVPGAAADALAALEPGTITLPELLGALRKDKPTRENAFLILGRQKAESQLLAAIALTGDPSLREMASLFLTIGICEGDSGASARPLLEELLKSTATIEARAAARVLAAAKPSQQADRLALLLTNHISATVRRDVARYGKNGR